MSTIQSIVQDLLDPSSYPEKTSSVELIETHISYIFLTGRFVYKIKKPVDFGFLDFTTPEKRRHFCQQEVFLNSRLSPDVYLGVVEIRKNRGRFSIGDSGETVEYAVKMRQLPRERMMGALLAKGAVTPTMIQRVADKIASFHARAEHSPEIARLGGLEAVKVNVSENFQQTERYIGKTVTREIYNCLRAYSQAFIQVNEALFKQRESQGKVRDCHGDLHTAQICLENGIAILDCIEFNERFRYSDVASDIAFLAMDLDYHGRPDLSRLLMESYVQQLDDPGLWPFLDFYKVYRAYVRGKVASFSLDSPTLTGEQSRAFSETARRYFDLAYSYVPLLEGAALFLFTGLMGTGKSSVARELAQHTGALVISSDEVRKEMAGIPSTEHRYVPWGKDIYSLELSSKTYEELLTRARAEIAQGRPVILDAAYGKRELRRQAQQLAVEITMPFWVIETRCPEETVRQRLDIRLELGNAASDGRWELFARQKEQFEEVTEVPRAHHIILDTSRPMEEIAATLLKELYVRKLAA
ncbi:MAG: AAA family ATPase [Chloroflexi bacterium]|nr:AAA family ATPase [Chloroflexota bacterium]